MKRRKKNVNSICYLKKAFDRVPRVVIWWILRKGVIERKITAIAEMHKNIKTSVKTNGKRSKEFQVKIRVHYGSVLSHLLFAVVKDEITKDVREGGEKELPYADDLIRLGYS